VYVAGRSPEKAEKAITSIKEAHPDSKGKIAFLEVDLSDLKTVKSAADDFMSKEKSLHVLTNNGRSGFIELAFTDH
jgi:retinol dehydrogenase-12